MTIDFSLSSPPLSLAIVGDSIAFGEWDNYGGWSQRLKAFFAHKFIEKKGRKVWVHNLAIPGSTTRDLLRSFEHEIERRIDNEFPSHIIMAIGINDARRDVKTDRQDLTHEETRENIEALINLISSREIGLTVVGLSPIDNDHLLRCVGEESWSKYFIDCDVAARNDAIHMVCMAKNVHFIDIRSVFLSEMSLKEQGLPGQTH